MLRQTLDWCLVHYVHKKRRPTPSLNGTSTGVRHVTEPIRRPKQNPSRNPQWLNAGKEAFPLLLRNNCARPAPHPLHLSSQSVHAPRKTNRSTDEPMTLPTTTTLPFLPCLVLTAHVFAAPYPTIRDWHVQFVVHAVAPVVKFAV